MTTLFLMCLNLISFIKSELTEQSAAGLTLRDTEKFSKEEKLSFQSYVHLSNTDHQQSDWSDR